MKVERFGNAMVGSAIKGHIVGGKAPQRVRKVSPCWVENCHMKQPRGARWRRGSTLAFPRVEANVVVVAAGRDECRLTAKKLLQFKAQ